MSASLEQSANAAAKKAAFLDAYRRNLVVEDALIETGIPRTTVVAWRNSDEKLRVEMEAIEAGITDKAHKMALKHAGIMDWSEEDKRKRLSQNSNIRMVEVLLRRDPRYREGGFNVTNNVMALTINGISADDIKKLVTPDAPQALAMDAEVIPQSREKELGSEAADIPFVAKKIPQILPTVMGALLAEKVKFYAERTAEGR